MITEFLDTKKAELIEELKTRGRPVAVIPSAAITANASVKTAYGAVRFFHEKVMEVPVLVFRVNGPPHEQPVARAEAPAPPNRTTALSSNLRFMERLL